MGCCCSTRDTKKEEQKDGNIDLVTENVPPDDTRQASESEPAQSDVKVYIALYDYDARTDEDLSFKKGDYLEVKPENCEFDWWMATSRSSGKTGYIPNNYVAEVKSLEAEE